MKLDASGRVMVRVRKLISGACGLRAGQTTWAKARRPVHVGSPGVHHRKPRRRAHQPGPLHRQELTSRSSAIAFAGPVTRISRLNRCPVTRTSAPFAKEKMKNAAPPIPRRMDWRDGARSTSKFARKSLLPLMVCAANAANANTPVCRSPHRCPSSRPPPNARQAIAGSSARWLPDLTYENDEGTSWGIWEARAHVTANRPSDM